MENNNNNDLLKWSFIGAGIFLLLLSILLYALGISLTFLFWFNFTIILIIGVTCFIVWIVGYTKKYREFPDQKISSNKINIDENLVKKEVFEYMFNAESISYRKDENEIVYSNNRDFFIGIIPVQLFDGSYTQIFGWHFQAMDRKQIYSFRMIVDDFNSKYYEIVNKQFDRQQFIEFCKEGARGLGEKSKFTRTHKDEVTGREVVEESETPFTQSQQQQRQPKPYKDDDELSEKQVNMILKQIEANKK